MNSKPSNNKLLYVSLDRPLPFLFDNKYSAIELIKKTKSLAKNANAYNKYFNKYYKVSETESRKSPIHRKLEEVKLSKNKEKANFSKIFNLEDNNTYMEVNFYKNYNNERAFMNIKGSRISQEKNKQSLPLLTCPSSIVVPQNSVQKYKDKTLNLNSSLKTENNLKNKEQIQNKLFISQSSPRKHTIDKLSNINNFDTFSQKDIIIKYLNKAYNINKNDFNSENVKLIRDLNTSTSKGKYNKLILSTPTPKVSVTNDKKIDFSQFYKKESNSDQKVKILDEDYYFNLFNLNLYDKLKELFNIKPKQKGFKDYFHKYLKNKDILLELKPYKIEITNYEENENFYKNDFYLPLDFSLLFYLLSDALQLFLLGKILIFKNDTEKFEFNEKMKIEDALDLINKIREKATNPMKTNNLIVEKNNSNYYLDVKEDTEESEIKLAYPRNNMNSENYFWTVNDIIYSIEIFPPRVYMKFKEQNTRLTKLLNFSLFSLLYNDSFKNWDYECLEILLNEKSFRDYFIKLVSYNTKEVWESEYILDKLNYTKNINIKETFYYFLSSSNSINKESIKIPLELTNNFSDRLCDIGDTDNLEDAKLKFTDSNLSLSTKLKTERKIKIKEEYIKDKESSLKKSITKSSKTDNLLKPMTKPLYTTTEESISKENNFKHSNLDEIIDNNEENEEYVNKLVMISGYSIKAFLVNETHISSKSRLSIEQSYKLNYLKTKWNISEILKRTISIKAINNDSSLSPKKLSVNNENTIENTNISNLDSKKQMISTNYSSFKQARSSNKNLDTPFMSKSPKKEINDKFEISINMDFLEKLDYDSMDFIAPINNFKINNENNHNNSIFHVESLNPQVVFFDIPTDTSIIQSSIKKEARTLNEEYTCLLFDNDISLWKEYLVDISSKNCFVKQPVKKESNDRKVKLSVISHKKSIVKNKIKVQTSSNLISMKNNDSPKSKHNLGNRFSSIIKK